MKVVLEDGVLWDALGDERCGYGCPNSEDAHNLGFVQHLIDHALAASLESTPRSEVHGCFEYLGLRWYAEIGVADQLVGFRCLFVDQSHAGFCPRGADVLRGDWPGGEP